MQVLVIGDVHGCFYTLRKLVRKHWKPEQQLLIQLGDLLNKGKHSIRCLKYWQKLERDFPGRTVLLRGNHEQMLIDLLEGRSTDRTSQLLLQKMQARGMDEKNVHRWLAEKSLKWESEQLLVTHAGINRSVKDPYDPHHPKGVLYNRMPLKCLPKTQVVGHTMVEGSKPVFNPRENAWFLDTGAWTRKYLSALCIGEDGSDPKIIRQKRSHRD